MDRLDIKSHTLTELEAVMAGIGEPKFRAKQLFGWLHEKRVSDFNEMTSLSGALREKCAQKCYINSIKIKKKLVSVIDNTVKYLYELRDGNYVETVLMRYRHGTSLCVSTQVGCRMGCRFCASALCGLVRSLTASEILDQVYHSQRDSGEKISSVVLMGIGEPLDNYDNVLRFLRLISDPGGFGLSLRHISLSTCGLVDKIDELAKENLQLTLSVSLHAADNISRSEIMPVNKRFDIDALMEACKRYFAVTGRRVSYEYALIGGVNDSARDAGKLAALLSGQNCHVNLIPVNPVRERDYHRSGAEAVRRFQKELEIRGITATVRRELGSDINAACGQLRLQTAANGLNL